MKKETDEIPTSKSFSDFIRNGSPTEKERVYDAALKDSTEAQIRVMKQAANKPSKAPLNLDAARVEETSTVKLPY